MAKGQKTGGRKKGTPNKRGIRERAAAGKGEMPLEYMLRRMRNPSLSDEKRDDMAKAAAPYCHARLATTQLTGDKTNPVVLLMDWLDGRTRGIPGRG